MRGYIRPPDQYPAGGQCYDKYALKISTIKFFTVLMVTASPRSERLKTIFGTDAWFSTLEEKDADRLLQGARERTLQKGQALYWRGESLPESGACFYGLVEGSLKASAHAIDGRETILRLLVPGNWFGELSILDGLPRDYSMTAETSVTLLEVSQRSFMALMQEPSFAHAITRLLGQRLRMFYGAFEHATSSPPLVKVAHRLLLIAHHGRPWQSPAPMSTLKVSQESLSLMLGLSRPTLIRALKTLESMGAIAQRYGEIVILDMQTLRDQVAGDAS